jgi:hypothetical protein
MSPVERAYRTPTSNGGIRATGRQASHRFSLEGQLDTFANCWQWDTKR